MKMSKTGNWNYLFKGPYKDGHKTNMKRRLIGDWTNRNHAKATEEAFNELAEKIVEKASPMIKN
jgi:hypothetical protein